MLPPGASLCTRALSHVGLESSSWLPLRCSLKPFRLGPELVWFFAKAQSTSAKAVGAGVGAAFYHAAPRREGGNTNGDDDVNIADPVFLLNFLFAGGPVPVAPFPDCGPGMLPADEELGCVNPPDCQ